MTILVQKKTNVFIHIGHGKTGTTAVQDMFWLNRVELLRNGIFYPSVGISSEALGLLQTGHHLLCNNLEVPFDQHQRDYLNKIFSLLRAEIESASPDVVFISSELLCYADPETPKLLSKKLTEYNVKIIYVVRRQDYLIPSAYLQAAKEGREEAKCTLQEYLNRYGYAFDFIDRIAPWQQAFGDSSISCIVLKESRSQDIRRIILDMINCSIVPKTLTAGRQNHSLGFEFIPFFQILNSLEISSESRWKIIEALERISGINSLSKNYFDDIIDACRRCFMQSNTEFGYKYLNDEEVNYLRFDHS